MINVFNENNHSLVYEIDLDKEIKNDAPQIIINCALPSSIKKTIEIVNEFKVPLIIAATGLTENDIQTLKLLSEKYPVVQSYNFSIGVQLLLKLSEISNDIIKDWDIEISETHHRFKKDKPSGTALMIKDKLGAKPVNISSLRLGNIVGDHTITFGGLGETVSISHHATSRRAFAEGILKSAEFALKKKNGFYSFKEVIFGG
ncbi:MAG TPA: dihydrodipicolinate reductase C-terminal domain-containing protein [Ignavibacteriaceae bacterium]|nr:dihydrodipicolinate reductase C-terminal domain-containing protein [Ignavibacteriaceae bacterium]